MNSEQAIAELLRLPVDLRKHLQVVYTCAIYGQEENPAHFGPDPETLRQIERALLNSFAHSQVL